MILWESFQGFEPLPPVQESPVHKNIAIGTAHQNLFNIFFDLFPIFVYSYTNPPFRKVSEKSGLFYRVPFTIDAAVIV